MCADKVKQYKLLNGDHEFHLRKYPLFISKKTETKFATDTPIFKGGLTIVPYLACVKNNSKKATKYIRCNFYHKQTVSNPILTIRHATS